MIDLRPRFFGCTNKSSACLLTLQVPVAPKTAVATTAEPATPAAASANSSTTAQLATPGTNGNLPAWAGLPPPPSYCKAERPVVPNRAAYGNVAVKGEAQTAVGISGVGASKCRCGGKDGGATDTESCSSGATVGTFGGGGLVGEKRLRWALLDVVVGIYVAGVRRYDTPLDKCPNYC